MRHLRLLRAMLGGAGLAGCVGLLAGQARADIVEFVPVRPLVQPVTAATPAGAVSVPGAAVAPGKVASCVTERRAKDRREHCDGHRVAMAPSKDRAPD